MLVKEQCMEIAILHQQGLSYRQISKTLEISRNTVKKYLNLVPENHAYKIREKKPTKLEAHYYYLQARVEAAAPEWLPATVLLLEIKKQGYMGGLTQLRKHLRTLKKSPKPDPIVRFETEAGEQMQVDWGEFKYGNLKLHAFVAALGFSRYCYVEFVDNEKIETLIRCHQNAFEFFDGIPKNILYDNMKTVVIRRNAYGQEKHKFHDKLWDYAKHMGFVPRLCKPYRARTKGKVERFIGYLRRSFFNPLASQFKQGGLFLDRLAANISVQDWLDNVANIRIHSGLKERPRQLWLDIEKLKLQRLPALYSDLQGEAQQTVLNSCDPHSRLLPGYNADYLQHDIGIYAQIQQAMLEGESL